MTALLSTPDKQCRSHMSIDNADDNNIDDGANGVADDVGSQHGLIKCCVLVHLSE